MNRRSLCPQATPAFIFEPRPERRIYIAEKAGSLDHPASPPLIIKAVFKYLLPRVVRELFLTPALS